MTDDPLVTANSRGIKARQLLENELLVEAFKGLEDAYTAFWRSTKIEDVAGREKTFLAINIVGKVRDHLQAIVNDGKLADKQLQDLANTAERKKRFGVI